MTTKNFTTVCRAVTFPFAPQSLQWKEMGPLLTKCWNMSTHLANWSMSELYLVDQLTHDKTADGLGPMPYVYLYGLFNHCYPRREEWIGAKSSAQSVFRAVEKKYAKERLDVLWRGKRSLASFRFPYPFPIHNKDWKPFYGKDNVPLVQVTLPGGRAVLRLRGGPEMRRQLSGFRQIVEGAKRGEARIGRKGGKAQITLVAHFPVRKVQGAENVLLVRTDPNALWVAEMDGTHPRIWNQDHIKPLVERHRIWLQRVSEDTKREKRVPRRRRRHIDEAREDRCNKQNNRLNTFCHEVTKELADFAQRQKVGTLVYDDRDKRWLERFPWFSLHEKLRYKCEDRGIVFLSKKEMENDERDTQKEGE